MKKKNYLLISKKLGISSIAIANLKNIKRFYKIHKVLVMKFYGDINMQF